MSENKFIKHLRGEQTAKSVLELKNQRTKTSFANMPNGTSNGDVVYSDPRGNATAVLKGTDNWKLDGSSLVVPTEVYGDGRDVTGTYDVAGQTLWVDASYTFTDPKLFTPNTKWVLKLCGNRLMSGTGTTIPLTLLVKFGATTAATKTFSVKEQVFNFSEEFVIDFAESNANNIKAGANSTMTVQLLCGDATATAQIYNGMTVFTALQRRVDGDVVASDKKTFEEAVQDIDDINREIIQIYNDISDIEKYVNRSFVLKAGDTMTGALNIEEIASSNTPLLTLTHSNTATYKWNIAPQYRSTSLSVYPGATETNGFRFATTGFVPASNNARYLGSASLKWKGVYTGALNNGANLVVPNKAGTLATMDDVELAARSGRMLTDQGVWYAKMYSATVAPAAEDGTNYADFSQVDGDNNPIIVIYERQSGAWVQDEVITPPAEYDGYVPITSKIWDIAEQSGQQGGRVLWNHQSKEFTPYPVIISFEDVELTGTSTVIMPYNPSANQIVNKDYVDTAISTYVGNATITLTQGGQTMGSFTTNQSGDATIALDGGSSYHPDLFDWKWADHQVNDVQWLRADTYSWQAGSVYKAAYKHLRNDMYIWASWDNNGTTIYTKKRYPEVGEKAYSNSSLTTELGEITAIADSLSAEQITVNGVVYDMLSGSNIAPTTETIAGVTVQYIPAEDGHKIVTDFHTSEVDAVYAATGVAWYYIIDYGFYRFKLPRTKFGVTGVRDTVGNYVAESLPNLKGVGTIQQTVGTPTGVFYKATPSNGGTLYTTATDRTLLGFDASLYSTTYQDDAPVQQRATQMYLYFYVGEFTQTALENTAGITTETINDLGAHIVTEVQLPTAGNNYTWYRKYADGWVEQGGHASSVAYGGTAITFPVTMADTNYQIANNVLFDSTNGGIGSVGDKSTTGATLRIYGYNLNTGTLNSGITLDCDWEVKGLAA